MLRVNNYEMNKLITHIYNIMEPEYKDGMTWEEYYYGVDTRNNVLNGILKKIENIYDNNNQ